MNRVLAVSGAVLLASVVAFPATAGKGHGHGKGHGKGHKIHLKHKGHGKGHAKGPAKSHAAKAAKARAKTVDDAEIHEAETYERETSDDTTVVVVPRTVTAPDTTETETLGASSLAPGNLKREYDHLEATDLAPGQRQKSGEIDSAREAAPGQAIKSEEATAAVIESADQKEALREILARDGTATVDTEFPLAPGVVVPEKITLVPLPPEAIDIAPDYSSYEYFALTNGSTVIVQPNTREVVYVLR